MLISSDTRESLRKENENEISKHLKEGGVIKYLKGNAKNQYIKKGKKRTNNLK